MAKIDIENLIYFIRDLVNEEFEDKMPPTINQPADYLLHGGCYELARILQHYFKGTQLYINNDLDHCLVEKDGILYDAEVDEKGQLIKKNPSEYKKANALDIHYMEENFGIEYKYINGRRFSNYLIDEIEKCNIKQYIEDDSRKDEER